MFSQASIRKRVFKIRKQMFRKNITGTLSDQWTENIKAHGQHGDESHTWVFKIDITRNFRNFRVQSFTFTGCALDENKAYEKCEVEVHINGLENFPTLRKTFNSPMFNKFDFSPTKLHSDSGKERLEIFITFASCNRKFFEGQKILFDEGILTDTIIKTKDQEFPCHKFVLASHSEYFKKMFQTEMKESQTKCVDWTEVFDASVVKDLLHFLYTSEMPPNITDNHFGLLEAAQLCLLPDLKEMCVRTILQAVCVNNAADVLQSAVMYESKSLQRAVVECVATNWDNVLATDFFQKLKPEIYMTLLKRVFEMFREKMLNDEK